MEFRSDEVMLGFLWSLCPVTGVLLREEDTERTRGQA